MSPLWITSVRPRMCSSIRRVVLSDGFCSPKPFSFEPSISACQSKHQSHDGELQRCLFGHCFAASPCTAVPPHSVFAPISVRHAITEHREALSNSLLDRVSEAEGGSRTWPMSAMARILTVESGPDRGAVMKLPTSDQPWSCACENRPWLTHPSVCNMCTICSKRTPTESDIQASVV